MKIEKLKFNSNPMNERLKDESKFELTNIDIIVMTKINELIDAINQNDHDRSEQMARYLDFMAKLESRIRMIEFTSPKEGKELDILLSCPFCGLDPCMDFDRQRQIKSYNVICSNSECQVLPVTDWFDTREEAIKVWNNRK